MSLYAGKFVTYKEGVGGDAVDLVVERICPQRRRLDLGDVHIPAPINQQQHRVCERIRNCSKNDQQTANADLKMVTATLTKVSLCLQ